MHPAIHALLAVAAGSFVGFSLAFVLMPDPTGVLPVLAGIALTLLLSPLFYRHFRKRRAS